MVFAPLNTMWILFALALLQLVSADDWGVFGRRSGYDSSRRRKPTLRIQNDMFEFHTLDCKRRDLMYFGYSKYSATYEYIKKPDGYSGSYDFIACGTKQCKKTRNPSCKNICTKLFTEDDQSNYYANLLSCPADYGFIGYCKDYRGLDEYIRICLKDFLYPKDPNAPLITQSGDCTGDDSCNAGLRYGDGDCDNGQCAAGLRCGSNNCRSMHKKGKGQGCFTSGDDCCTRKDPLDEEEKELSVILDVLRNWKLQD